MSQEIGLTRKRKRHEGVAIKVNGSSRTCAATPLCYVMVSRAGVDTKIIRALPDSQNFAFFSYLQFHVAPELFNDAIFTFK